MNAPIKCADDFMNGQRDCIDGKPHKAGMSTDYDRGYAAQYEHEQNLTNLGVTRGRT